MVDLYGAAPGTTLALPLPDGRRAGVFVRGVWRDYARQYGAIVDRQRRLAPADAATSGSTTSRSGCAPAPSPAAIAGDAAPARRRERLRRDAARVRVAARDPRDLAAHLRPQLRRHLLAAGGGDRDRPVRHRRELLGAGAGAPQGVRPARPPRPDAAPDARRRRRRGRRLDRRRRAASACCWASPSASCWSRSSIRRASTGRWTCCCPGRAWSRCALRCICAGTLTALLSARRAVGRQSVLAVKEDW